MVCHNDSQNNKKGLASHAFCPLGPDYYFGSLSLAVQRQWLGRSRDPHPSVHRRLGLGRGEAALAQARVRHDAFGWLCDSPKIETDVAASHLRVRSLLSPLAASSRHHAHFFRNLSPPPSTLHSAAVRSGLPAHRAVLAQLRPIWRVVFEKS